MQQQQRRCGAPRCSAAGIAEAIAPIVGVADHQPNLATHVPKEKEEGEEEEMGKEARLDPSVSFYHLHDGQHD